MRTRAIVAAALAVAVATGAGTLTGALAAPADQGGAIAHTAPASPGGHPVTVTLLTGDRVTVTTMAGGRRSAAIHPAEGRDGIAFLQRTDGDRLVAAGRGPADVLLDLNK